MTRKDYEIIARGLSRARGHWVGCYGEPVRVLDDVVEQIAIGLAADNPKFNRDLFITAACTIPSEVQP